MISSPKYRTCQLYIRFAVAQPFTFGFLWHQFINIQHSYSCSKLPFFQRWHTFQPHIRGTISLESGSSVISNKTLHKYFSYFYWRNEILQSTGTYFRRENIDPSNCCILLWNNSISRLRKLWKTLHLRGGNLRKTTPWFTCFGSVGFLTANRPSIALTKGDIHNYIISFLKNNN